MYSATPIVGKATDPVGFFRTVREAFLRAKHAVRQLHEIRIQLAEYTIQLHFAGTALVPAMTEALAHLEIGAAGTPDLTICAWDSASTGITLPPPPWSGEDYIMRGEIRGYNNDRIRTAYQSGLNALSMLDRKSKIGLYWLRSSSGAIPFHEKPFQAILNWWLGAKHDHLLHAAAVGTPEAGVLLTGRGGSGKSVSTLACLRGGLTFLGDDYVMVRLNPEPTAFSVFNSIKVHPGQLSDFPEFAEQVVNRHAPEGEKALVFARRSAPGAVGLRFPVCAILIPRISGRTATAIEPAAPMAAVGVLTAGTVFALPGAGGDIYRHALQLDRCIRTYTLHLGTDLSTIPRAIQALLNGEVPHAE